MSQSTSMWSPWSSSPLVSRTVLEAPTVCSRGGGGGGGVVCTGQHWQQESCTARHCREEVDGGLRPTWATMYSAAANSHHHHQHAPMPNLWYHPPLFSFRLNIHKVVTTLCQIIARVLGNIFFVKIELYKLRVQQWPWWLLSLELGINWASLAGERQEEKELFNLW